jgi:NADP-dependent 3-hydroxy acid dehydrogenase YdfG
LEPLTGEDIAETIIWAVSQPAHVNISEIVVMPSQQANAYYNYKKL